MMQDALEHFPEQFEYEPEIAHIANLQKKEFCVVVGMGGSHLGAGLVNLIGGEIPVMVHSDYGLPNLGNSLKDALIIVSSYSGNTEESLDAAEAALAQHLALTVIATGGKLLEFAEHHKIPYVKIPKTGIQPRSALGFNIKALLKLMGNDAALRDVKKLKEELNVKKAKKEGEELAKRLREKIPVIYASRKNTSIAYNWKIKFNETGKIPAFYNVFPELNHNEMTGFDVIPETEKINDKFHFIFVSDPSDDLRIQKRFEVTKKLYEKRGFKVEMISLEGNSIWEKIFNSLLLADWAAVYLASYYGAEPEDVPMVEEFKKMIA